MKKHTLLFTAFISLSLYGQTPLPDSIHYYNGVGNTWDYTGTFKYIYSDSLVSEQISVTEDQRPYRTVYTYDSGGRELEHTSYNFDSVSQAFRPTSKWVYTYDTFGNRTSLRIFSSYPNPGSWMLNTADSFYNEYNPQGHLTTYTHFNYTGTAFQPVSRYSWTNFDSTGQPLTTIRELWKNSTWTIDYKLDDIDWKATYSEKNFYPPQYTKYTHDGSNYVLAEKVEADVQGGKIHSTLKLKWNGTSYDSASLYETLYDAADRPYQYNTYEFNNGWTLSAITHDTATFGSKGQLLTQEMKLFENGTWRNYARWVYFYGALGIETKIHEQLFIYPNPAGDRVMIHSDGAEYGDLYIFDLNGRMIYTEKNIQVAHHTLDLGSLDKGIFMLKLVTESKTYTGKFVKH